MARPLRIEFPQAFYHITSRGNEKKAIFKEDPDYKRWLFFLQEAQERYHFIPYGFVLMPNHYHLLLETPEANLSKIIHYLNSRYTLYFNRKYSRVGHFFQGRYKSIVIEKENYLLEVSRYLHLNPVRAGLVKKGEDWLWSSYGYYLGKIPPSWLERNFVLSQFGGDLEKAQELYQEFVEKTPREVKESPFKEFLSSGVMGTSLFTQKIKEMVRVAQEIPASRVLKKKSLTEIVQLLEKFMVTHKEDSEISREKDQHQKIKIMIFFGRKFTDTPLKEMGIYFGKNHYSTITKIVERFEKEIKESTTLKRKVEEIENFLLRKMSNVKT